MIPGEFVELHAHWDTTHPSDAAYERTLESARRLRDMPASREFPCPGVLRCVSSGDGTVVLGCDACPFQVAVRQETVGSAEF